MESPYIIFKKDTVTVHFADTSKLIGFTHANSAFNREKKQLAMIPCVKKRNRPSGFPLNNGSITVIDSPLFCSKMYSIMGWNTDDCIIVTGEWRAWDEHNILLFDLTKADIEK